MDRISLLAGTVSAQLLAAPIAVVFMLLGLLHVYWAMGGTIGSDAAVPQRPADGAPSAGPVMVRAFTPSRGGTLLVATALLGVAALLALRTGLLAAPISHPAVRLAVAAVAVVMLARAVGDFRLVGFFKTVKGTTFARRDTLLYSPLCVVLGVGLALLA
jgi:hypothetical protein